MRMNVYRSLAVFLFVAWAYAAIGQVPSAPAKPDCNCSPHDRKPYTAEFKITSVQTLANGTTLTRESTETDEQDSQGRHLHALTELTPQMGQAPGAFVNANDPVDGTQSSWDSRTKTARVIKLPPKDQRDGCWVNDSGTFRMSWHNGGRSMNSEGPISLPAGSSWVISTGPGLPSVSPPSNKPPKPEMLDLGMTTIEGLQAHGQRFTTTIQPGEIGNDAIIVSTSESWVSTEFGLVVRQESDDPRTGKRTRELVEFSQSDPDPATFLPPEGYEVTIVELHKVECAAAQ
jgi:hypothetical protein